MSRSLVPLLAFFLDDFEDAGWVATCLCLRFLSGWTLDFLPLLLPLDEDNAEGPSV